MPRLDQYQIGDLLGEGGIGRVHAAYDSHLGREVAIKSLRPGRMGDVGFVERFRAEATNLARLNHPNITTIYDLLEHGRSLYIVMERVHGATLELMLKQSKGGLGIAKSIPIIAQVADGLAYAHVKGVIHRDIKPANIMITPSGLVKIMDFGIARLRDSQRMTRDGQIIGTLAYMAPEQLRGEPTDERSDLYSLAMVLYEMLTGAPPFVAASEYDLIQAQMNAKPARLPGTESKVEAALLRALAKKPSQRFASVAEFKNALAANSSRLEARTPLPGAVSSFAGPVSPSTAPAKLALIPRKLAATLASLATRLGLPAKARVPLMAGAMLLCALIVGALMLNRSQASLSPEVNAKADANHKPGGGANVPASDVGKFSNHSVIFSEPTLCPGCQK